MPYGYYGGYSIGNVLNTWADMGVFAYLLPFLMIFAIVYGILHKTSLLGDNKGVQAVISLSIGLLALQFDYVSNFYATIFPYAGMGIAVLLVALIFLGFASDKLGDGYKWIWVVIGGIIFIVVLVNSLTEFAWFGGMGYGFVDAWPAIIALLILLGLMALIIWGGDK